MILHHKQTTALDYLEDGFTNEVGFGGGAGGGKSQLGCYWQLKQRLKYPGTRGVIARSTLKTLRETTLNTFLQVAKMQGVEGTFKYKYPTDIVFNNGSHIFLKELFLYPSDPEFDELGSLEITDAFVDQSEQCVNKAVEILHSRIRYKLDENNLIPKSLYAFNPKRNWVKTMYRDQAIDGTLPTHRKFVPALVDDNPFISKYYIGSLMKMSKQTRERLRFGNWDYNDDPSQLITSENIQNIFKNSFVPLGGKRYITADIARFGKDKVIIRVWDGWRVIKRVEKIKSSIVETADEIKKLAFTHQIPMSQVLCDEDGIGGGVVDILKCKGFVANTKPFTTGQKNNVNFGSLKDQCGFYLAQMVNNGKVYEACENSAIRDLIVQELEELKDAGFDTDGKKKLVSKDKIKENIGRSPDELDTYNMRAWFDLSVVGGIKIILSTPQE